MLLTHNRIIAIFAEAFSVDAIPANNDVYKRMVVITKQVQVCAKEAWIFKFQLEMEFVN